MLLKSVGNQFKLNKGWAGYPTISNIFSGYPAISNIWPDIRQYNLFYYTTKISVSKQSQALFLKLLARYPLLEIIRYPAKYILFKPCAITQYNLT